MRKKKIVLQNVAVEDYGAEGKSIARLDGKVIFIENAVPGDIVNVQLRKNKKDWGEGYATHFHNYSKDRITPFCQHFGVCGGCQWQMLPYVFQLQYKQQQVFETLKRIGKIQFPELLQIAGAEQDKFYRNKLEYTFSTREFTPNPPKRKFADTHPLLYNDVNHLVGSVEKMVGAQVTSPTAGDWDGAGVLGFHAKGFFDKVVDIQKCWLQQEPTNQLRNSVRQFAIQNRLSFYDIRNHTGLLRTMQVRIATTGEIMINVVFGEDDDVNIKKVLNFIQQAFPQITTLVFTINLKKNDSMHDLEPQVYFGKGFIVEKLEDFIFQIGPKSFFQTNTKQAESLYRITRDFAELTGNQVLYDLYCGTGSIGIFCSKRAKKVIGIDIIDAAVEDARRNAALNNIDHAIFVTGDVTDICNDDYFAFQGSPDVIITDPPRAGMHQKLVQKILDIQAPVVVYVSCNPATQARDLALMDEKYSVTKVQPVDMFPHTHHIETVVQLKLKKQHR